MKLLVLLGCLAVSFALAYGAPKPNDENILQQQQNQQTRRAIKNIIMKIIDVPDYQRHQVARDCGDRDDCGHDFRFDYQRQIQRDCRNRNDCNQDNLRDRNDNDRDRDHDEFIQDLQNNMTEMKNGNSKAISGRPENPKVRRGLLPRPRFKTTTTRPHKKRQRKSRIYLARPRRLKRPKKPKQRRHIHHKSYKKHKPLPRPRPRPLKGGKQIIKKFHPMIEIAYRSQINQMAEKLNSLYYKNNGKGSLKIVYIPGSNKISSGSYGPYYKNRVYDLGSLNFKYYAPSPDDSEQNYYLDKRDPVIKPSSLKLAPIKDPVAAMLRDLDDDDDDDSSIDIN